MAGSAFPAPQDMAELAKLIVDQRRTLNRLRTAIIMGAPAAAKLVSLAYEYAEHENPDAMGAQAVAPASQILDDLRVIEDRLRVIGAGVRAAAQAVSEHDAKLARRSATARKYLV